MLVVQRARGDPRSVSNIFAHFCAFVLCGLLTCACSECDLSKSPNKHNILYFTAEPRPEGFSDDVYAGHIKARIRSTGSSSISTSSFRDSVVAAFQWVSNDSDVSKSSQYAHQGTFKIVIAHSVVACSPAYQPPNTKLFMVSLKIYAPQTKILKCRKNTHVRLLDLGET